MTKMMTAKRTLTTIKNNLPTNQFMAIFLLVTLLMPITAPVPAWAYTLNLSPNTNNGFELTAPQPTLAASTLGFANDLMSNFGMITKVDGSNEKSTEPAVSKSVLISRVKSLETQFSEDEKTVKVGESLSLSALPTDAKGNVVNGLAVEWKSSDTSIIAVNRGEAIALQIGIATLSVNLGKVEKKTVFNVVSNGNPNQKPISVSNGVMLPGSKILKTNAIVSQTPSPRPIPGRIVSTSSSAASPTPDPEVTPTPAPAPTPIWSESLWRSMFSAKNNLGSPNGQTENLRSINSRNRDRLGASNFSFGVPGVSLPGRGLNASVGISYNSRVWNKSTNGTTDSYTYDVDQNWLSPGFNLSYGYLDYAYGGYAVTSPTGTRHYLAHKGDLPNGGASIYESADGEFVYMLAPLVSVWGDSTDIAVTYADGTSVIYGSADLNNRKYAKEIVDRNGNTVSISYLNGNHGGRIASIRDTLNRYIVFHYDNNATVTEKKLISITAPGFGANGDREVMRFYYGDIPFTPYSKFAGSVGYFQQTGNPTTINVLKYVYYPDTHRGYKYEYSNVFGIIYKTTELTGMQVNSPNLDVQGTITSEGQWVNWTKYNYPVNPNDIQTGVLLDVPKYNQRRDDWVGRDLPQPALTTYSVAEDSVAKTTTVTQVSPDGLINESISNLKPAEVINGVYTDYWDDGLIKESSVKSSATTVLSKQKFTWIEGNEINGRRNPRLQKLETTNEANETRATTYEYDGYNNATVVREHDFAASGTLGTELRRTETSYVGGDWVSARLIRLPSEVKTIVNDAVVSRTRVVYDDLDTFGNPANQPNPVNPPPNITRRDDAGNHRWEYNPFVNHNFQVCSSFGCVWVLVYYPQKFFKGNVTKVTSFSNATATNEADDPNASISTTKYDMLGNAVEAGVNCCRRKVWTYDHYPNDYHYPSSETKGDAGQETTSAIYDTNTGLMTSGKDENNQITKVFYDPTTLRQIRVEKPNGAWSTTEYGDQVYPFHIKQTGSLDTNRSVSSWNFFDGRGASYRTRSQTAGGYLSSDVEFDSIGRPSKNYNPYTVANLNDPRPTTGIKYSEVTQRDGFGRPTQTTLQDLTTVSATYNGTVTTATDQAGKSRRQLADALGRIVRVDEPDASGNLGAAASPIQPTSYEYDGNDNLNKVTQSDGTNTQIRLFKYDSLSRLTNEKQVEATATLNDVGVKVGASGQWTGVYKYDVQGLLTEGVDARGVKTTFAYDGLRRVASVSYTGESGYATPNVTYTYDEVHSNFYNKGRLTKVQTAANAAQGTPETIQNYDYDKIGQVVNHTQSIGNQSYNLTYGYNLAGQLTNEKYPSGKVFNYSVDDYGRLQTVADAQRTYLSSVSFTNQGLLSQMNLGNGTNESFGYNERFQMTSQNLNKGSQVLQKYDYGYGQIDATTGNLDLTKNNGQLGKIESFVGTQKQATQKFSYDSIGRLSDAKEYKGTDNTLTYKEHFDFDRFGNLYRKAANNGTSGQTNPVAYTPIEDNQIDKSTNRFTSGTNTTYVCSRLRMCK